MNENDTLGFLPKDSDIFQYTDAMIGYLYRNRYCQYPAFIVNAFTHTVTVESEINYVTGREEESYDLDIQCLVSSLADYTKLCSALAAFFTSVHEAGTFAVMDEKGKWPVECSYDSGYQEKYDWTRVLVYDKATGTIRKAEEADSITEEDYKRAKHLVEAYEAAQEAKASKTTTDDDWKW